MLANIHEWKNSFTPFNRLPSDIISLIPTYLPSQKDRFRTSFVCRHWRRIFLQRAELWSELDFLKGEDYVKTLLERSKGTPLVVQVGHVGRSRVPVSTMTLLSPHTGRVRVLGFVHHGRADIQEFVDANPGPFPLLDSLTYNIPEAAGLGRFDVMIPPSTHLFATAVNLRKFHFYSESDRSPPISHFAFPNLVEFDFRVGRLPDDFPAPQLLDFLEASPMLRAVRMKLSTIWRVEDVPQERVIVLPNVEDLDISVAHCKPDSYDFTTHISCPSITSMSLVLDDEHASITDAEEIFPTPAFWNAIAQQYTRGPLEEVILELDDIELDNKVTCMFTLRSSDAAVVKLSITISTVGEDKDEVRYQAFIETTSSILNHPQLANIKRFSICHNYDYIASIYTPHTTMRVGRLLKSLGPLDEFTIYRCNVQPYSLYFLRALKQVEESVVFSPIKRLIISLPLSSPNEGFTTAIVGLAQSRHALGVPFEQVVICAGWLPAGVEEALMPWVANVEYCYEEPEYD